MDPANAAGRLVAVPVAALARLRGGKPMHPSGAVFDAVLARRGSTPAWGVPWLDATATEPAVVRLSRGAGLPASWPDLLGLAVTLPGDDGPVHLLLGSTGPSRFLRWVPVPRRSSAVPYSSIMGYRSGAGILRLAALPGSGTGPSDPAAVATGVRRRHLLFTLAAARGADPWRPFGRLALTAPREPHDPDVRFDAVRHPPPGLIADGAMARFRAPAYARAQAARTAAGITPPD